MTRDEEFGPPFDSPEEDQQLFENIDTWLDPAQGIDVSAPIPADYSQDAEVDWYQTEVLPARVDTAPAIRKAARLIREGELVAFPTETVYGLGANGLDPEAVAKIFVSKGRPQDNPLILHIALPEMLEELVRNPDDIPWQALRRLWPGPITFIFEKSDKVPDVVTAGGSTVAVRLPTNEVARSLIYQAGVPIAAPSANLSGRPSPTSALDVLEDMNGRIPLILNGGHSAIGLESTVVDLTSYPPTILRPGFYPQSVLRRFFPMIRSAEEELKRPGTKKDPAAGLVTGDESAGKTPDGGLGYSDKGVPKAPGMKYRHYAPHAHVSVYMGRFENQVARLTQDLQRLTLEGRKVGCMVFEEYVGEITKSMGTMEVEIKSLGSQWGLERMGQLIFREMREFDRMGCDEILIMGVPPREFGVAIMNRLKKASGGNIIWC